MSADASSLAPASLFDGEVTLERLDEDIYRPLESFPTTRWWLALSVSGALAGVFAYAPASR
jgi:hypothetical protein